MTVPSVLTDVQNYHNKNTWEKTYSDLNQAFNTLKVNENTNAYFPVQSLIVQMNFL